MDAGGWEESEDRALFDFNGEEKRRGETDVHRRWE
jgi:hypothetical protein